MASTSTPIWSAPHNGIIGDASAVAGAGQVNQLLGAHGATAIYPGAAVVQPQLAFAPTTANPWNTQLSTQDVDQPITMSGTSIGRVTVPILPVGAGADLLVSLWSDNGSGSPGSLICQTRIPQSWIAQLAPVAGLSGPVGTPPIFATTGNPLAVAQFFELGVSLAAAGPYAYPTAAFSGLSEAPSTAWYEGTVFLIGGVSGGSALTGVYTIPLDGSGVPGASQVQPAFPTTNDGSGASVVVVDSSTGDPILLNLGGSTSFGGALVATVYAAQWNPTNGTLGSWSAQTALPQALEYPAVATYEGWVYVIGGRTSASAVANTVYYNQVQNGQLTGAWQVGCQLPQAAMASMISISPTGTITVAGGTNAAFTSNLTNTWFAQINPATGAVTPWQAGPALPNAEYVVSAQPYANAFGSMEISTGTFMPATQYGQAFAWTYFPLSGYFPGFVDFGNGQVLGYVFNYAETEYGTVYINVLPQVSVPLPVTGLTSGATYHVMLQQQGGDAGDYLVTTTSSLGYSPTGPTVMTSPADTYTWTAGTAHYAVPVAVYNQAAPSGNTMPGLPLHTWEDNGARITTLVSATTPDQQLLGVCEATRQATALNSNTNFETGLAPWTGNGGAASQSTTQVYLGQHSAKVVPSGSASLAYLQSEQLFCVPGQWITVTGWMWFTNAVTSQASMSINWYNATGTFMSTSANSISVPAATWTQLTNTFQAPSGAYQFSIDAALGGTPAASQVFFVDTVHAHYAYTGPQTSSVTRLLSPGTWPGTTWPALGTEELA